MQSKQKHNTKIGILGGGQLGRMFIQQAISYNQEIHVLDPDPNAPCKNIASHFVEGDFRDFETVIAFGRSVDILTIEIEQVNIEALEQLEREGIDVFPQSSVIRTIQDKGTQKFFYTNNQIPTSPFILIDSQEDIKELDPSWFPCFVKSRKDGYDGKGVQLLSSPLDYILSFDVPSIIEKAVQIELEFAVIIASNGQGDIKSFPLIDMEFNPQLNLVDTLSAPSRLTEDIQSEAIDIAQRIIEKLGIRGILAIEFFLTKEGEILVNEMAPRTHNSGHHTIEGNATSQFEQHFRAILGWPLGDSRTLMPAVMINLLGEDGYQGPVKIQGLEEILKIPMTYVHLYGKNSTKPFRKMGHVTILANSYHEAHQNANIVKEKLKIIS